MLRKLAFSLGLVILLGVAFAVTQTAFHEPTSIEKAEGALEAIAKTNPKAFERPEYRLPRGAAARSLRDYGLPIENGAEFPDAFNNAGALIGAMLAETNAYNYRCDTIASVEPIIDSDRVATDNLWLSCNRGQFKYSFTRLGGGHWSFVKVLRLD
ncbi:MAG: hypothetical protein WAU78_16815 [Roseiarcus sp.]